jgi:type IX secretion system PorP/SprF family membrane protein
MMRKVIYILLFLICTGLGAQDVPYVHRINQYLFNGILLNPAYAGSREAMSTTIMHRTQWAGFKGSPMSQSFAAHTPTKKEKIALGIMVDNFSIPSVQYNSIYLNYAYRIWIKSSRLSLGLKAGGYMYKEKLDDLLLRDPVDPAFVGRTGIAPNFGAGAYFYNQKYFIGLSIPFFMSTSDTSRIAFDFKKYHVILSGGYLFDFSQNFRMKPSFILDYNKFILDYQFGLHFITLDDMLWIGGAYKSSREISAMVEVQINPKIKIGYAYDYSMTDITRFSNGSHEILLRYELMYKSKAQSPFYF